MARKDNKEATKKVDATDATTGKTDMQLAAEPEAPAIEEVEVELVEEAAADEEVINVAALQNTMTEIVPLRTEAGLRIGPDWYSFNKGTITKVPKDIVPHLQRCGIV